MREALIGLVLLWAAGCSPRHTDHVDWPAYLGGDDRNHYSPLESIDTSNVSMLRVAWTFHSGDSGQMQCNPLIIGGVLYGITASNSLVALDAATGVEIWRFVPERGGPSNVNRGLTYWEDGSERRILFTFQSWLYAIDPTSGRPIRTFGDQGRASLKAGLGASAANKFVVSTSPGTLYGDVIVMPTRVGEGPGAAPGHIQAFHVRTGQLAWVFHTIPKPGTLGHDTWPADAHQDSLIGGANCWAGMAVDRERGIVYIPTGSATFDFFGGNRKGKNLFANSLVALEAETGAYRWHYQFVHHDIWDRDLPAPPNLVTIQRDGKRIDAVAQVTKSGHVFVFDRVSGVPVYPIDEVAFPPSDLPEEQAWPTQPIPRLPKPFARQSIDRSEINAFSRNREDLLRIFDAASKGTYQPLGLRETIFLPGADGGAEWGGAAVDPGGVMYINSNEMAWLFSLSGKGGGGSGAPVSSGEHLYTLHCAPCHRADRTGNPASGFPDLTDVKHRLQRTQLATLIAQGKGMMPGFTNIGAQERQSIISYLFGEEKSEPFSNSPGGHPEVIPYTFNGYNKFLDQDGYPAITPPWGTLTAIDLNNGQHLWQVPLGEYPELTERGIPTTGTENYGGPVVTAGGVLFIAATKDSKIRAFSAESGRLLWEHELPASGFATPATYAIDGKQFIVIACGGTKLGTHKGDSYVAFALP